MTMLRRWWEKMMRASGDTVAHRDPAVEAARARLESDRVRMDQSTARLKSGAAEIRRQVRHDNHISASIEALLRRTR